MEHTIRYNSGIDPTFKKPERIDILIGAGLFAELLGEGKIRLASYLPRLLETKLGWIVSGNMTEAIEDNFNESIAGCAIDDDFNAAMERLSNYVKNGMIKQHDEMKMGDIYYSCQRRTTIKGKQENHMINFSKTIRQMKRDTCLSEEYHNFMDEYLQLGHMTQVTDTDITTTKCIVVFDASCKTDSGRCFNDILLTGPQLKDDLVSILLRFRFNKVAMVADVEKMYWQVLIDEEDRELQCFFRRSHEAE
uniref:Peptidase aspartic putative domain-containing protein n=1 Tax=Anopheles arabiensis TaxID=7173 RepID=A0A182I0J5_ANOAR